MSPHSQTRDLLLGVGAAFVVILLALIGQAVTAPDAHSAPRASTIDCREYARTHRIVTGSAPAARVALRKCQRATVTIACLDLPSAMGSKVCAALAEVRPTWATDPALHELLRRESGFNPNAVNEDSGACSLFQRLPCPWDYYGGTASPSDDRVHATALEQVRNGVRYISGRYRTPSRALSHHDDIGWY